MSTFDEWTILSAVKTTLDNDASVAAWANEVLITDWEVVLSDPDLSVQLPLVAIKEGDATRVSDGTGSNCGVCRFAVDIAVITEYHGEDPQRLVKDAVDKRKDVRDALDGSRVGLAGSIILGPFLWRTSQRTVKLQTSEEVLDWTQIAPLTLDAEFAT